MTRGFFAQIGIKASVFYVRLSRTTEPPRRTGAIDLFGLAGRFWGRSARQTADIVYSTMRSLQDWFPRLLSGQEGVVKPGKETRLGEGKVVKQQHLSGMFSLNAPTPAYLGARLAMAELVDDQRVVPGTEDVSDVEFLNTGGEGEMGAFLAYEAELEREGVEPGFFQPAKVVAAAAKNDDDDFVPLDPTEQPLPHSELLDFASSLNESSTPDGATAPVVESEAQADQPWTVHQFILDGDFLLGPADQVIQRWEVQGDVLLLEVVDVKKSIKKAGEAVKQSFLSTVHADRSAARQRLANGVTGDTPIFDSVISKFEPHSVPTQLYEDVAFGIEALTGDYGAKLAEGVGPVTLAKLGVISNGDWDLWQKMVAERVTWADPISFHRSIIAHFVHPAASPASHIFGETLDVKDQSQLNYSVWVSSRAQAHRNLARSFDALDLPFRAEINLTRSDSSTVQSLLWRVLSEEICIIPAQGWQVSSGLPDEPSTFLPSVAGSGIPGSPREFPILASNLKPTHLELLGLSDEARTALGPRSTVPIWRTNLLIKEIKEQALEATEKAEVTAEADEELAEMRREDESKGLYYVLSEEANRNIAAANKRTGQAWRARRRKRWLDLISAFLQHVQACCPTLDINFNFEIADIDTCHIALLSPEGDQLCTISPVFNVELFTDKLSRFTPAEQDKLLPGGSFDVSSVTKLLTKDHTRGRLLRRVFTEVSKSIGVPIVDDQAERLSVVSSSGFAILRKPSVLSKILSLPRYRINKDVEGYDAVLKVGTWFGLRKFVEFAVEQKKLGLFDLDHDGLATLAPLLQKWVNRLSGSSQQKPHIIAALNSIGFASRVSLWDALVPTTDRAQKALDFFRSLEDHTWVEHRDVQKACTWIQGGTLKDYLEEAADAALHAVVPSNIVIEDLSADERQAYLGGEIVHCWDPRVGPGCTRSWWRACDGRDGDLLDEEMQEDERRATETRNTYLDEALAMLRTWPDTHFLTYDDLEHYAMKVDPKATHSQPGAESVFDILRKAACTRYKVDPDAEEAVTGLMKVIGAHARGYRLRWHSTHPDQYPSTLPTPISIRKRDAAAANLDDDDHEKPKRSTRSSSRASSSAATASKGKGKSGGSSRSTRSGK